TRVSLRFPHAAVLLVLLAGLLIPAAVRAQFGTVSAGNFEYPAEVTARVETPVAFVGDKVRLLVTAKIREGHYTYGMIPLVDPEAFGPVGTSLSVKENTVLKPL